MRALLEAIIETIGWAILGFIILFIALRVFDLITPTDYRSQIRQGNTAAAIFVSAFILSLTAIIVAVIIT